MSRSAAGRAGGRRPPAPTARPRRARRGRGRLAGRGLPPAAPSAQAAPRRPDRRPGDDDDRDDHDRPVRIDVGRFEPRTVTAGRGGHRSPARSPTPATSAITDLAVRLQRGEVMTTRAELAAADRDPDPATTVHARLPAAARRARPRRRAGLQLHVAAADLALDQDGVYPVLVNVNGTVDGEQRRVGELSTFLVQQPGRPRRADHRRLAVAAGRAPAPRRLRRLPRRRPGRPDRPGAGSTGPSPSSSGCPAPCPGGGRRCPRCRSRWPSTPRWSRSSRSWPPAPTRSAASRTRRPRHRGGGGLPRAAARRGRRPPRRRAALRRRGRRRPRRRRPDRRPGPQPARAPRRTTHDPGRRQRRAARPPSERTPDGAPGRRADPAHGARILADALDVEPRTDLAWAAGGSLRPDTLATLQAGGVEQVVLGSSGLTDGPVAVGLAGNRRGRPHHGDHGVRALGRAGRRRHAQRGRRGGRAGRRRRAPGRAALPRRARR